MQRKTANRDTGSHRVHVVVFDGFQLLDATGPAQVFATANDDSFVEDLLPGLFEFVFEVDVAGGDEGVDTGTSCTL